MVDEPSLPKADPAVDAKLDSALSIAFRTPPVPSELRAGVLAAVAREPPADSQHCREELEKSYRASIANLNARYLRRGRAALIAAAVIVITIGSAVRPLSLWLTPFFRNSAPIVAGVLALGTGFLLGAIILQDLFGRLKGAGFRP